MIELQIGMTYKFGDSIYIATSKKVMKRYDYRDSRWVSKNSSGRKVTIIRNITVKELSTLWNTEVSKIDNILSYKKNNGKETQKIHRMSGKIRSEFEKFRTVKNFARFNQVKKRYCSIPGAEDGDK